MKHIFLLPFFAAGFSILGAATPALRFLATPSVERFPDGSFEWRAAVTCADPGSLSSHSLVFSFDTDLDGASDGRRDSTGLSFANCDSGQVILLRTFFPATAAILTAELKRGGTVLDRHSTRTGQIGSLLSIHRFCARPASGEPEWIEVHNGSSTRINLSRIRVEGHLLGGGMEPGVNLLAGRDSLELLRWQPAADVFATSSWSYLRNTGDTLRLTWDNTVVLDSLIYGAVVDSREACASAASEEDVAAASGYALEVSPARWNPRVGPLILKVMAPNTGFYDLRLYDLDGFELCAAAKRKKGSAEIGLSSSDCPGLVNRTGSILLQLQPSGSASLRKRIRILHGR